MATTEALTRDEWSRRFAARIMEVAGWDERAAMRCAAEAANQHESNEREAGDTVDWLDPEEYADVEMSYWDDDEATDS
jgi:hypothetical protein